MNVFGSKTTDDGRKAKACGDTRKLLVLPLAKAADGNEYMDPENIKFGGPMLLRVPAASLKVFSEYGAKLQQMGMAYYGVVTRLEFDPTQAYPKFVLRAVRVLNEWEANEMIRVRDGVQAKQILEGSHSAAPALLAPPAAAPVQQAPAPAPAQPAAAPLQAAPIATAVPVQQAPAPAPVQAQPMQMPLQAAPVQAAPLPPPPQSAAPVLEVLNGRTRDEWRAANWHDDQQLVDAGHARWVQAAPTPLPGPPALPPPPAVVSAAVASQAAPVAAVQVSESLLGKVDALLAT
jgi:hypothetical protein